MCAEFFGDSEKEATDLGPPHSNSNFIYLYGPTRRGERNPRCHHPTLCPSPPINPYLPSPLACGAMAVGCTLASSSSSSCVIRLDRLLLTEGGPVVLLLLLMVELAELIVETVGRTMVRA